MSVDLLRELLHCPRPGEAEEEHVIRAVDLLQLSLKVVLGASSPTSGMCMKLGPFVCSWCFKSDSRNWVDFVGDQQCSVLKVVATCQNLAQLHPVAAAWIIR